MALRVASRAGSLMRVAPQLSAASARGFASFEDRERGEEACAMTILWFCRTLLLQDLLLQVQRSHLQLCTAVAFACNCHV